MKKTRVLNNLQSDVNQLQEIKKKCHLAKRKLYLFSQPYLKWYYDQIFTPWYFWCIT